MGLLQLVEQLGIANAGAGQPADAGHHGESVGVEGARNGIDGLEHADDPALRMDGRDGDGTRIDARETVDLLEALIVCGVADHETVALADNLPNETLSSRNTAVDDVPRILARGG